MSNEIVLPDLGDSEIIKTDDDAFAAAASSGDYLPRVQLMTASAAQCKSGKFNINHYAMVSGQNFIDLGASVDVLVIDWRPKALDTGEDIIVNYDQDSETFKSIQARAGIQDSGCMFGPEFLIWIPSVGKFATMLFGNPTARNESPNMKAQLKSAATLGSQECSNKRFSWFGPSITPCSTPLEPCPAEDLEAEYRKFKTAKSTDLEAAPAEGGTGRER